MSRKSETRRSLWVANNALGGGVATRAFRNAEGARFINWAFSTGQPMNSLAEVTPAMIKAYLSRPPAEVLTDATTPPVAKARAGRPNSTATQHNKLSALRRCLVALKVNPEVLGEINPKAMGLEPRCRKGKKLPIPDSMFFEVVERANDLGYPGLALMLKLDGQKKVAKLYLATNSIRWLMIMGLLLQLKQQRLIATTANL